MLISLESDPPFLNLPTAITSPHYVLQSLESTPVTSITMLDNGSMSWLSIRVYPSEGWVINMLNANKLARRLLNLWGMKKVLFFPIQPKFFLIIIFGKVFKLLIVSFTDYHSTIYWSKFNFTTSNPIQASLQAFETQERFAMLPSITLNRFSKAKSINIILTITPEKLQTALQYLTKIELQSKKPKKWLNKRKGRFWTSAAGNADAEN